MEATDPLFEFPTEFRALVEAKHGTVDSVLREAGLDLPTIPSTQASSTTNAGDRSGAGAATSVQKSHLSATSQASQSQSCAQSLKGIAAWKARASAQASRATGEATIRELLAIETAVEGKLYHQFHMLVQKFITTPSTDFWNNEVKRQPEAPLLFVLQVVHPLRERLNSFFVLTLVRDVLFDNGINPMFALKFLAYFALTARKTRQGLLTFKSLLALQFLRLSTMEKTVDMGEGRAGAGSEGEGKGEEIGVGMYIRVADELLLDELLPVVESSFGLPATAEAEVHRAVAALSLMQRNHDLFYRHAMCYLSARSEPLYVSDDCESSEMASSMGLENSVPHSRRKEADLLLAKNLCKAVLMSDKKFAFSELLDAEILRIISPGGWAHAEHSFLRDLLVIANSGDLQMFVSFVDENMDKLRAEGLHGSVDSLTRKVRMFALLEAAFLKPQKNRVLTFKETAGICQFHLSPTSHTNSSSAATATTTPATSGSANEGGDSGLQVQTLLISMIANGLIKGQIDQLAEELHFTGLQPRRLDEVKIQAIADQFAQWSKQIFALSRSIAAAAPQLQNADGGVV